MDSKCIQTKILSIFEMLEVYLIKQSSANYMNESRLSLSAEAVSSGI